MHINSDDIASLDDHDVKRLALAAAGNAEAGGSQAAFWRAMSRALVAARRDRQRMRGLLEQQVLDERDRDVIGAIVEPGDDGDAV